MPSGSKAFDWTVPKEWKIDDAYIIDPKGKKFANLKRTIFTLLITVSQLTKKFH